MTNYQAKAVSVKMNGCLKLQFAEWGKASSGLEGGHRLTLPSDAKLTVRPAFADA